jgi:hypothetical protein
VTCPIGPGCTLAQSQQHHTGTSPPFFRLDARVEKKWRFSNERWLGATLEAFNASDQGEVAGETFSPSKGFSPNQMNPIILPSIGISGGF